MFSRRTPLGVALVLVTMTFAAVPPASAHCDPGTAGAIPVPFVGLVSTCENDKPLEDAIEAFNKANGGQLVYILVKDFRFHPQVATVKSGGTVVWVYADTDHNAQHTPRSSGQCANGVNPEVNPLQCVPIHLSSAQFCFDFHQDNGIFMTAMGQTYPVTFRYLPAESLVQKSHGFMSGTIVGDLTGAKPFKNCPSNTSYNSPAKAVLPYHCGVHGLPTDVQNMRALLILVP